MALIPNTFWGLLYLGFLLTLMAPSLFSSFRRNGASIMLFLWLVTRIALLPDDMPLTYRITSIFYTIAAIGIMQLYAYSVRSVLIACCLAVVSLAGLLASWGLLSLDGASTLYEAFGVLAMIFIVWPKDHGFLRHVFYAFTKSRSGADFARSGHIGNPAAAEKRN